MSLEVARNRMLGQQLRCAEVLDSRVLDAMREIPRERFVPPAWTHLAYADTELPIGHEQVMLTPLLEGRIMQAISPAPHEQVLEIGTGTGYMAACLARLASQVTSLDIFPDLIEQARSRLDELRVVNCQLRVADAFSDEPGQFDAIAVTGSVPVWEPRFEQWLKPGGRAFVVAGQPPVMEAWLIRRQGDEFNRQRLFETLVPPLLNARQPAGFSF